MITKSDNPWLVQSTEIGQELQRSDLWRVDLSAPLSYIRSIDERILAQMGVTKQALPASWEHAACYAQSVDIPAQAISTRTVVRGTGRYNYPSYRNVLDATRIVFIHDDYAEQSAMVALMTAWSGLTRAGRVSNGFQLLLESASYRPVFKFPVYLRFMRGSSDGESLVEDTTYTLHNAWPSSSAHSEIDRGAAASIHTFSVSLHAERIVA